MCCLLKSMTRQTSMTKVLMTTFNTRRTVLWHVGYCIHTKSWYGVETSVAFDTLQVYGQPVKRAHMTRTRGLFPTSHRTPRAVGAAQGFS